MTRVRCMQLYTTRVGTDFNGVMFLVGGYRLFPEDTADSRDMVDGDVIDACLHMTGD